MQILMTVKLNGPSYLPDNDSKNQMISANTDHWHSVV